LAQTEYALINDTLNGSRAVIKGPLKHFLNAFEEPYGAGMFITPVYHLNVD